MFNIGFFELIILGIIGLVVLGPEELPQLARKAAKLLNEFKRMGEGIIAPVDEFKAEADKFLEKTRHELVAEVMNKKNQVLKEKTLEQAAEKNSTLATDEQTTEAPTTVAKKD